MKRLLAKLLKSRKFLLILVSLSLVSCSGNHRNLVEKAEEEALQQRSQLAKYLFLQVIEKHSEKDDIRYRALKGLADVTTNQVFDYPLAVKALDTLFDEYSQVERYQEEIKDLRLEASIIWRKNLQKPRKALDVMSPLMASPNFKAATGRELGLVYVDIGEYEQAKHWFNQAWHIAFKAKDCRLLRSLQLDIIQVHSVRDLCDETLKWANQEFPPGCSADDFAVSVERAHCYEMSGEVPKALEMYEELVKKNPQNTRAHFFLDSLRRRQKEKEQR